MKAVYPGISLVKLCRLLGITRQAHYQQGWREQITGMEQELVLGEVRRIRNDHRRMGGRKLYEMLEPFMLEHGIKMGRDALFDLLAAHQLLVRRKRRKVSTTQSHHWLRKWDNLAAGFSPAGPNELWVSDITYLRMPTGFLYISLITDACSRKIVGYHIADNLAGIETLQALRMALELNPLRSAGLIHHSDRGVQYCSDAYVDLLQQHGIKISMTQSGDPLENAMAERVNGIIKQEYMDYYKCTSLAQAAEYMQKAVKLYNTQRPHLSIGMLTPEKVHKERLQTERLW